MLYPEDRLVWLPFERAFGRIVGPVGAHYTRIQYSKNGLDFDVLVENGDFEILEDLIEYDSDD